MCVYYLIKFVDALAAFHVLSNSRTSNTSLLGTLPAVFDLNSVLYL